MSGRPDPPPVSRTRRITVAAGRIGLAAAILFFLFREFSPGSVMVAARSVTLVALLGAFLLALLAHVAVADRLRRVIGALGIRLSTPELLEINLATVFYGLVLPAGNVTGILARFYKISRREANYGAIAVGLGFERLAATLTLCVVGIVCWLLDPGAAWPPLALMGAALAAGLVAHLSLVGPSRGLGGRMGAALARFVPRGAASLRGALGEARTLAGRTVAGVYGLSLLTHALGIGAFAILAGGLHLELSLATIAWTRSAALLVAILPISVAGLGVREGAMVVLLEPYGVAGGDALTYSLLAFVTTVLGIGVLGGLFEARRLVR